MTKEGCPNLVSDSITEDDLLIVEFGLTHFGNHYNLAAQFIADYLDDTGDPVLLTQEQIEQMLLDNPAFAADVKNAEAACEAQGKTAGSCVTNWRTYCEDDGNQKTHACQPSALLRDGPPG
jgi:hypothetical protein